MVRGPLFALRLSLLALAFSLGAFLVFDGFLVVPLAAPHLRAVHLDSTCLPAAERDRTNSERRKAALRLQSSQCFHCLLAGRPLQVWPVWRATTPCRPPRSSTAEHSLASGPALACWRSPTMTGPTILTPGA